MNNQPSYEELMSLYLSAEEKIKYLELQHKKDLEQHEKDQTQILENQLLIQELLKVIEDKEIKLKKQLNDRFGIKSDKKEVVIANEAETIATEQLEPLVKEKKKPGRKHGSLDAAKFDMSIIEHEERIIENDNICDACGAMLVENGETIKTKVEITPTKVKVIKYIIKNKRCPNCDERVFEPEINCFNNESFLTPSLASFVVNNKYNYALPLYRIESMLTQLGAPITRVQLANYCINIAQILEPIYERLKYHLLNTNVRVLHADETPLQVIEVKERKKCYIWLYATSMYDKPIYVYEYQESREAKHPTKFLENYQGYLVCDDYSSYEKIEGVSLCRCWFHAKKKYADFIKTMTDNQKKRSQAVILHNKISKIFDIESKYYKNKLTPNEIKEIRLKELKPLVEDYFNHIENLWNNGVDKSSHLGKAINYSLKIKDDLMMFFNDGHIPLTNNLCERGIKPFVILRKNCLFSYTEHGAEASAILMSVVQTAKMNLLKPDEYIKYVLENIDNTKASEIDKLLPFNVDLPKYLKYDN